MGVQEKYKAKCYPFVRKEAFTMPQKEELTFRRAVRGPSAKFVGLLSQVGNFLLEALDLSISKHIAPIQLNHFGTHAAAGLVEGRKGCSFCL